MKRHKVDGDAAFSMLVGVSKDLNLRLTIVARHLAQTGNSRGGTDEIRSSR